MKRSVKKHSRVGARSQEKLKKWSGTLARPPKTPAPPRKRPLDLAKDELRRLFS